MTSLTKTLEDVTIVWLDVDRIHENRDDFFYTKTCLRQCHSYIEIYNDANVIIQMPQTNRGKMMLLNDCRLDYMIVRKLRRSVKIFLFGWSCTDIFSSN
ncbi:unnamed protein product [Rotaria sp. Silwood2]|nr:unnamed protein product [Rotaria sp. Silwood2]CAF3151032.1 unnamed protein product [Rotaria sp. Silwood2]CAF3471596.1 unnamed protein product [Rotaria sp. Silwood2]CAF4119053.1 unnamed protein product [Rotaria sp. Silwood2]CAF4122154.1 unnamed protein product [Rotaria sp. Silwood2]